MDIMTILIGCLIGFFTGFFVGSGLFQPRNQIDMDDELELIRRIKKLRYLRELKNKVDTQVDDDVYGKPSTPPPKPRR